MNRPPELDDLIGPEGGADDRARLQRVHELLVAAGPPAEGALPSAPGVGGRVVRMRRRRWAQLALAAAFAVVALSVGYVVGSRGEGFETVVTLPMHGVPPVPAATAELAIGEADNGNIPIKMRVRGLPALPAGGWYELFLSKHGRIGASCGTFSTAGDETTVQLSVGYNLRAWRKAGIYDGWVITAHVPGHPQSAKRVLLTT